MLLYLAFGWLAYAPILCLPGPALHTFRMVGRYAPLGFQKSLKHRDMSPWDSTVISLTRSLTHWPGADEHVCGLRDFWGDKGEVWRFATGFWSNAPLTRSLTHWPGADERIGRGPGCIVEAVPPFRRPSWAKHAISPRPHNTCHSYWDLSITSPTMISKTTNDCCL